MGIEALLTALPLSGIEADWLARLSGFLPKGSNIEEDMAIYFLEPPSCKHVPYIDPVGSLSILFRVDGMSAEDASVRAVAEFTALRAGLPVLERPRLYRDSEVMNVPECVSVPRFVSWVKSRALLSESLIEFIEHTCDLVCRSKVYNAYDNEQWRLDEMPDMPPPKAMFEFFIGLRSDIAWEIAPKGPVPGEHLPIQLLDWRDSMRPVVDRLEQVLGEKVYHFEDFDDDIDDDSCHRFLALHCWCSLLPESNYIRFLLEVTGLPDVEALKSALIDPRSYSHPFIFNEAFGGIESKCYRFQYGSK